MFSSGGRCGQGPQANPVKYALVRWFKRLPVVEDGPVDYDLCEPTKAELKLPTRCVRLEWDTIEDNYHVVPLVWLKQVVHIYNPPCGVNAPDTFYVNKFFWGSFASD